jgi:DNA invertase Pin-like site-specific DNA recombinase
MSLRSLMPCCTTLPWATALSHLRSGDTLVVSRLDRLARSLTHLIQTVNHLASQEIAFKSITENIDTSSATGKLTFHIFGALAEFERNLIKERTIAGLATARARGKSGGRPKRNPKSSKVTLANKLYADKANIAEDICRILNISRATLYRCINV